MSDESPAAVTAAWVYGIKARPSSGVSELRGFDRQRAAEWVDNTRRIQTKSVHGPSAVLMRRRADSAEWEKA